MAVFGQCYIDSSIFHVVQCPEIVVQKNMQAHMKRNSKTSILFTLSISFLIFSASSFNLIATLIEKTVLALLGADLYGLAVHGYMTEVPIAEFLDD